MNEKAKKCEKCGSKIIYTDSYEFLHSGYRSCSAIVGVCDDCLADEAADWNYSMHNPHNEPY